MRISDWSSDVCSSDLRGGIFGVAHEGRPGLVVVCGGGLAGGLLRSGLFALRLGDLRGLVRLADHRDLAAVAQGALAGDDHAVAELDAFAELGPLAIAVTELDKIGRASCRERGCQSV